MAGSLTIQRKLLPWKQVLGVTPLALVGVLQVLALFQEPEARAIALGYFGCGATTFTAWLLRRWLRRLGRSLGRRFILLGVLGAIWVETIFWVAEKLTGAVGVAASSNLLVDLLVTMPWYITMVVVLWFVQRRFRYSWTVVALLGGLYEVGADGIVGHVLGGNMVTLDSLAMLCVWYWGFVVVYSPIVLPPVWASPLPPLDRPGPRWQWLLGAVLPLLPLLPYWLMFRALVA